MEATAFLVDVIMFRRKYKAIGKSRSALARHPEMMRERRRWMEAFFALQIFMHNSRIFEYCSSSSSKGKGKIDESSFCSFFNYCA